ncbi:hypothetical protein GH714_039987 [Hevea brasiliensis]|uniref:Uncharacterized protein n=1 Tax=Hevea brasiliensis TaxID=3981 RepID=A0A6A6ML83_HEVBR|nr:hypothetical protein GH714_039987 [Hevea brasiliensis]
MLRLRIRGRITRIRRRCYGIALWLRYINKILVIYIYMAETVVSNLSFHINIGPHMRVLEIGIVLHSTVIGKKPVPSFQIYTIKSSSNVVKRYLIDKCIGAEAEYGLKMNAIMVFLFSATTPLGIVLGIGLSNVYSDNSPPALIVVGALNASSAGLLNYMALVVLLSAESMGPELQKSVRLQIQADMAVLLGAGGMSLMAKWA